MNDRINELASQCIDQRWTVTGPMFDREKFAELIIRECASIDFYNLAGFGLYHHDRVHQVIKEHFGVEE